MLLSGMREGRTGVVVSDMGSTTAEAFLMFLYGCSVPISYSLALDLYGAAVKYLVAPL